MWFKMSNDLLYHPAFWSTRRTLGRGDNQAPDRWMCVIRLLCASADGIRFADVEHFRQGCASGAKVAQDVWRHLTEAGVLRDTGDGWSAYEWMAEQGLFGEAPRKAAKRAPRQKPEQEAERKDGVKWDWQLLFEENDDQR